MPKRISICIGVNQHLNAPSANLRFAVNDAQAVASLLEDPKRGEFNSVKRIFDADASKERILAEIDSVLYDPTLTQDDLVLIYFSGHGALDKGDNLFLVPHDVDFLANDSINVSSTVHTRDLEIRLDNTQVGHIVVILDACHSGASGQLLGRIKYRDNRNIILVGAARFSEKAWETPELEHGRFTECLLRAANDRPTLGEWITLQQVLSSIQIEMQKLGDGQIMEISSHSINPNICLSKNPLYSLTSQNFTKEVEDLCKLAGYQLVSMQPGQTIPNIFIARELIGFGRQSQMLVMCLDNLTVDVTESHIVQFRTLFQSLQRDSQVTSGMVVTRSELPGGLKKLLAPLLLVVTKTKDELQRNLIGFGRYLDRLIDEFEKDDPDRPWDPPLKNYYIELDAKQLLRSDKQKPITDIIGEWLNKDNASIAIILGGYGTGKTTFSKKLAYDLAKGYLTSQNKREGRVPVLFYLRDFPKAEVDIESFVIAHLKRHCQVINPDFNAFRAMNDAGLFLLIFDGFDEMAVRADEDVIRRNLVAIERFAAHTNAKILLTSRPEFFRSIQEEQVLLTSDNTLTVKRPQYERIALLPLTSEQVENYLQKRIPLIKNDEQTNKDWVYYREQIKHIPGFADLTRRPVLLEMIVKTLPELVGRQEEVNRASLYNRYLRSEIARQQEQKQRRLLIKQEDRFHLMQVIARHFYTKNPPGLTAEQIQGLLTDEFSRSQREELEAHMRDFLSASFLIREGDQYRFSHRSIMEYLAAKDLADEIEQNKPKVFQSSILTPEVRDFLIDLKPEPDLIWRKTLKTWISSTAGKDKETAGYLGGNAVTILNFMKESFEKADLKETVLRSANFRRANCEGAIFHSSNLEDADLSECNLTKADLTNIIWKACPKCGCSMQMSLNPSDGFICQNCNKKRVPHVVPSSASSLPLPRPRPPIEHTLISDVSRPIGQTFTDDAFNKTPIPLIKIRGAIICKVKGLDKVAREFLLNEGAVDEIYYSQRSIEGINNAVINQPYQYSEIICPTCSTANVYDAITCLTCGTSLSNKPEPIQYICSVCQTIMIPGTRFCGICGALFAKIQCSLCNTLNSPESSRCYRCGTELPAPSYHLGTPSKISDPLLPSCPVCGSLNSASLEHCKNCNSKLIKVLDIRKGRTVQSVPIQELARAFDWIGSLVSNTKASESTNNPKPPQQITVTKDAILNNEEAALISNVELPTNDIADAGYQLVNVLHSGSLLANQYRVLQVHGRGGFNIVYLAEDIKDDSRLCVIKQSLTQKINTPDMYPWEAMQLAKLEHRGLPKVYDVIIEAGKWYSVIEYIEGETLEMILKDATFFLLPEEDVITWMPQICEIVLYLHSQQPPIIVRDIKPGNFIFRNRDKQVVMIDLSASRFYKPGQEKDTIVLGTPGYAPPEQFGHAQTDVRSDIYSLGVTMYQLLTGQALKKQTFEITSMLETRFDFNPKWDSVITKATQPDPDNRYQSVSEMIIDLANIAAYQLKSNTDE